MLSPEYKISEQESREAVRLWLDEEKYRAMSEDEQYSIDILMDAEKLGRWPVTVEEVEQFLKKENEEYWMTRFGKLPPQ
jgi:hypothetical protein